ncbi:DUF2846 domain-containing protein [Methylotenera sp. 1P/1]|uniref:DUF2846 domain-containing protein n=1 Tax=Methylotenera sp. 1P/1 TaxID=1131551 RepID=UPI0003664FE0|nr:DUF2846 domain-containing protein [Methylotenera sp. 1P/1]
MHLRIWTLIFIALISGCATASGPAFKKADNAAQNNALIYVYRKDMGHWQSAYSPTFILDGTDVASMPREGYLELNIRPGEHTFEFKHNYLAGYHPVKLTIPILSGQVYYLRISDPINFGSEYSLHDVVYRSEIAVIEEKTALIELATTKLVSPKSTFK